MAALGPLRQVIVDDTDPSIRYNAVDWFPTDVRTLNNGNFGPVFNATSHTTTSSNTEFSFTFTGTSITVQGNLDMSIDPTTNATDPAWQCLVDGKLIPNKTFTSPESNWHFCSQSTLAPEEHLLTVKVQSQTKPFFLDSLVYTLVPEAVFSSAVLIYPDGDPALTYSASQWKEAGEQVTQIPGASVTLEFHGTSATLIGHTSNTFPPNASSGSYFIDGAGPTPFILPGLASATSSTQFNGLFFTTPPLADGFHNVTVVYDGDDEHTPLAVKVWYVTNTTVSDALVQASASGSATLNTTPSSAAQNGATPSDSPSRRTNTGPIVGGIIGAIFLVGVILAVLYVLRWRRSVRVRDQEAVQPTAYPRPTMPMPMHTAVPVNSAAFHGQDIVSPATAVSPQASWVSWGASAATSDWGASGYAQPQVAITTSQYAARPNSTAKTPNASGGPVVVQHEDSGARSVGQPQDSLGAVYEVVEVPPGYTPM
ncbi:hypothetical protein FB45DRAFT_737824 [Roridomyces roridus]|uniref:Transmembrane protein n=1 Tax=Roridomyces roridus TaxID=1738132 RepID=A0AAD7C8U7_9AGAR|nr:hypothetical protein FB45DRAFT_737824 [Roridomyces roridus]